ncbi:hypothetical protein FSARC_4465 [Fusarium sarcochroum]|uniref:Uncharacterized protein n=1 Tax=Fusarium sarcochroum TaxID=1208366 RepID=A0A8H4XBI0_9HYPO|nr:hypothetical protein FSARC_4465 [Fusarium sarcochroum]
MLPLKHLVHVHTLLCCLLTFALAKDDPDYNPSSNYRPRNVTGLSDFYGWIGSYYNATAEVELEIAPGNVEEGLSPTPNGYWRPNDGAGRDNFNFTTSQMPGGAYNISGSMQQLGDASSSSSSWSNVTLPVCNTTHLNGDYNMGMPAYKWWNMEDWDDFMYPHVNIQFDEKTANLTLDGVFHATPYVQSGLTINSLPTLGGPPVRGFIRVRFFGVLDTYHSDSLSVNAGIPSWSPYFIPSTSIFEDVSSRTSLLVELLSSESIRDPYDKQRGESHLTCGIPRRASHLAARMGWASVTQPLARRLSYEQEPDDLRQTPLNLDVKHEVIMKLLLVAGVSANGPGASQEPASRRQDDI